MRTLSICNVTFAVWAYAPHAENVEQIMNRKVQAVDAMYTDF